MCGIFTAGSYSWVSLDNKCKSEEFLLNSDTKHETQVDSSNNNTEDKLNFIKVSTSFIWKNIMF